MENISLYITGYFVPVCYWLLELMHSIQDLHFPRLQDPAKIGLISVVLHFDLQRPHWIFNFNFQWKIDVCITGYFVPVCYWLLELMHSIQDLHFPRLQDPAKIGLISVVLHFDLQRPHWIFYFNFKWKIYLCTIPVNSVFDFILSWLFHQVPRTFTIFLLDFEIKYIWHVIEFDFNIRTEHVF